ncbi:hypothetical protein DPMN_009867 [Dreissena polymorpha]|uniref:Uncharacterized protein n=1 Tax=Dreissena polymorpha TaxID=45954 RepID=A0A9D4RYL3_DREPO|nr:hypothetical protein DPMN_009867 [Dreissena polymorpha]
MPFPRRKAGARMRVNNALEKKRQECKKLLAKHIELKTKYKTKMIAIQIMKVRMQRSALSIDTQPSTMSPKTLTKYQIKDMRSASKIPQNVKRQLLLGKTVLSEIRASRKYKSKSSSRLLSIRLLKKYRLIGKFSQNTA